MDKNELIKKYTDFYEPKLLNFGANPKGVDMTSIESQEIRYKELIKIFESEKNVSEKISVLDFGCGYGEFFEFLKQQTLNFSYTGYDILPLMIDLAKTKHFDSQAKFTNLLPENQSFDYVIANGIFTLKFEAEEQKWKKHVFEILENMNHISRKGFAFTSLTSYSDKHLMKDYLYYANPLELFDYCKTHFSKYVSLLHDYPKYEFTILVRKDVI